MSNTKDNHQLEEVNGYNLQGKVIFTSSVCPETVCHNPVMDYEVSLVKRLREN